MPAGTTFRLLTVHLTSHETDDTVAIASMNSDHIVGGTAVTITSPAKGIYLTPAEDDEIDFSLIVGGSTGTYRAEWIITAYL